MLLQTAHDVEIVVNNAGVLENASPLSEHAVTSFEREIKVNVVGLINMARAFAPVLKANGGGALVQLNSVVSMKAFSDFATYSASKARKLFDHTIAPRSARRTRNSSCQRAPPVPSRRTWEKKAGLEEIAEPPSLVSDSIWQALKEGQFQCFSRFDGQANWQFVPEFCRKRCRRTDYRRTCLTTSEFTNTSALWFN